MQKQDHNPTKYYEVILGNQIANPFYPFHVASPNKAKAIYYGSIFTLSLCFVRRRTGKMQRGEWKDGEETDKRGWSKHVKFSRGVGVKRRMGEVSR